MFVPSTQHQAVAECGLSLDYDCAHCGWSGEAASTGYGLGTVSGLGFGMAGAREESIDLAEANAVSEARDHIRMAPCPRCGRRQKGTRLRVLLPLVLISAAVAGVTSLALGGLIWASGGGWLAIFGVLAGLVAPFVWVTRLWRLLMTQQAVVFLGSAEDAASA